MLAGAIEHNKSKKHFVAYTCTVDNSLRWTKIDDLLKTSVMLTEKKFKNLKFSSVMYVKCE